MEREDPFAGSWKLNPEKSHFDPNHRVSVGTMRWERTADGYLMKAEGSHGGQVIQERPATFVLDDKEHPVPGQPGTTAFASSPAPNIIQVEAKNAGHVVGKGSYIVSEDGATLTATMAGTDAQQRIFQTVVVWDRQ
ncbi:MAG TPA: hypothetical protein VEJ67_00690 [Candidatus Cybelea sp.]|nr:hypothetical protein [Candidatus Cybelea sp.]